ncbi:hypothetical protein [Mameliella sediminis]|uniref:hypothetical protein n=1 Tax=Mameliella sediminis TaxID=2836866 RepID=UPI001C45D4D2|nr:hypothetical protein [Mameliella sediminis]MBV7394635.1 hypothetical protein [Mameliella sediminis]
MSKEKNRGNREAKKPKKEKVKVLATANSNAGKDPVIAGKAVSNKLARKPGKAPRAA